ncbi:MAG: hypothetical protein WKG03_08425 [Telluria sp.]
MEKTKMTLNDAVLDGNNWTHNASVLRNYLSTEVFFEIVNPSPSLRDGVQTASADNEITLQLTTIGDSPMAVFFTTKNDPRIQGRIGGVVLHAAAKMLLVTAGVDGLLLQSDQQAWIGVKKEELNNLISA